MSDSFWNDDLVDEYSLNKAISAVKGENYISIETFKQSKQPKRDWEITYGNIDRIISVRRISDNEVFSIGDDTNFGRINGFHVNDFGYQNSRMATYDLDKFLHKMMVSFDKKDTTTQWDRQHLCNVKKSKPILFYTEDDKPIYENDVCWWVNTTYESYWDASQVKIIKQRNGDYDFKSGKYFSTEEAAKSYVILNKPCITANEIIEWYKKYYWVGLSDFQCEFINAVKKIAEQKINK